MAGAAVVPDEDVTRLPVMRVLEARILQVIAELLEERTALGGRELVDAIGHEAADIEGARAGFGNRAHDRMARGWRRLGEGLVLRMRSPVLVRIERG